MMIKYLTAEQREEDILDFIKQYIKENKYAPSIQDICNGVELKSKSSGHHYLKLLVEKGYIKIDKNIDRSIVLLNKSFTPKEELEKLEQIGKHNRAITKNWLREIEYDKLKKINEAIDNIYEGISELKEHKVYKFMAEALETVLEANMELVGGTETELDIRQCDRIEKGEEI